MASNPRKPSRGRRTITIIVNGALKKCSTLMEIARLVKDFEDEVKGS